MLAIFEKTFLPNIQGDSPSFVRGIARVALGMADPISGLYWLTRPLSTESKAKKPIANAVTLNSQTNLKAQILAFFKTENKQYWQVVLGSLMSLAAVYFCQNGLSYDSPINQSASPSFFEEVLSKLSDINFSNINTEFLIDAFDRPLYIPPRPVPFSNRKLRVIVAVLGMGAMFLYRQSHEKKLRIPLIADLSKDATISEKLKRSKAINQATIERINEERKVVASQDPKAGPARPFCFNESKILTRELKNTADGIYLKLLEMERRLPKSIDPDFVNNRKKIYSSISTLTKYGEYLDSIHIPKDQKKLIGIREEIKYELYSSCMTDYFREDFQAKKNEHSPEAEKFKAEYVKVRRQAIDTRYNFLIKELKDQLEQSNSSNNTDAVKNARAAQIDSRLKVTKEEKQSALSLLDEEANAAKERFCRYRKPKNSGLLSTYIDCLLYIEWMCKPKDSM